MVWLLAQGIPVPVEQIGGYLGIAAFFGLALLSVLYFAQAREVKRLRDWAGAAPERARESEERATGQAGDRLVQQQQPATAEAAGAVSTGQAPRPDTDEQGGQLPSQAAGAAVAAAMASGERSEA